MTFWTEDSLCFRLKRCEMSFKNCKSLERRQNEIKKTREKRLRFFILKKVKSKDTKTFLL